jgi:predicted nuclease with RNAse H fold
MDRRSSEVHVSDDTIVIGIDAAVAVKNRAATVGRFGQARQVCGVIAATAHGIGEHIRESTSRSRVLLAIDAPLGWPDAMRLEISSHRAGGALDAEPDRFFRRECDRWVKRVIGQQPLDVGADRIARTAHAALSLLNEVRRITRLEIPLVWSKDFEGVGCIEVYPAATLKAYGAVCRGYKRSEAAKRVREDLVRRFASSMADVVQRQALASDHVFDAAICTVAGFDFLADTCLKTRDEALAGREGWIWVRDPCRGDRLERECAKLDAASERSEAEERFAAETPWPEI